MNLYIPEIGDRFKLEEDWTFTLYNEQRNWDFYALLVDESIKTMSWSEQKKNVKDTQVTLPKGTVLKVDRIYIRQGADKYSSLTFYAEIGEGGTGSFGKPKHPRFWAKLSDCNKIKYTKEGMIKHRNLKLDTDFYTTKTGDYVSTYQIQDALGEEHTQDSYSTGEKSYQGIVIGDDREHTLVVREGGKELTRFKILKKITIKSTKTTRRVYGILGTSKDVPAYSHRVGKVEYTLKTENGEILGTWGSMTTVRKKAKEWVLENIPN